MNEGTPVARAKTGDALVFEQVFGCPLCGAVHVARPAPAGYVAEIRCRAVAAYCPPATTAIRGHIIHLRTWRRSDGSVFWRITEVAEDRLPIPGVDPWCHSE